MNSSEYYRKFYHYNADENQDETSHRSTDEEIEYFHAVRNGNLDYIHKNIADHRFLDSNGVGRLSIDPVINLKYHMVVSTALITRLCIEKGLEAERAFRMSDYYIRQLDNASTIEEVEMVHNHMTLDFTSTMRMLKKNSGITRPVTKCIDYIYSHINERITIEELAEHAGVSTSYLSRQFSKELDTSIRDYIREKKVEIAADMLLNTDKSISDIAFQLSFASQSHFISVFKSITGLTPKKYRSSYRKQWLEQ